MFVDLIIFLIYLAVLFAPSVIAYRRKLKRRLPCLLINIFLGWTVVFWLPILIWSLLTSAVEE